MTSIWHEFWPLMWPFILNTNRKLEIHVSGKCLRHYPSKGEGTPVIQRQKKENAREGGKMILT